MKVKALKRIRAVIEELEPRILYSADAGALLHPDALAPVAEVRLLDGSANALDAGAAAATASNVAGALDAVRHELLFVDTGVNDYQKLVDGLLAGAGEGRRIDVLLLDPTRDGIAQVTAALAAPAQPVDALHFITHGGDGTIKLGGLWVRENTRDAHAEEIAGWQHGLAADADILLYGCDVADDGAGRALVNDLHQLTGANVA